MTFKRFFWLAVFLIGSWLGAQVVPMVRVPAADINNVPYRYSGLIEVERATGSGSLVGRGAIVTAAHVLFNESSLAWSRAKWQPRRNTGTFFLGAQQIEEFQTAGSVRWSEYQVRTANDDTQDGFSSFDTFNADFAVAYQVLSDAFGPIKLPPVAIHDPNTISMLRLERPVLHVGYPQDDDEIALSAQGFMHHSEPFEIPIFWAGLTAFPETWLDSDGYWMSLHTASGLDSAGGASGGAVYVLDAQDEWVFVAAHVAGSNDPPSSTSRGVDPRAWALIEEATALSRQRALARPVGLTTSAGRGHVDLNWTFPEATAAIGFRVQRRDAEGWHTVAELGAEARGWQDVEIRSGATYQYRVAALGPADNRSPYSLATEQTTLGHAAELAAALDEPFLQWRTTGAAPAFVLDGRVQTGDVDAMEESRIVTDLIGPGSLRFRWSVSSEPNADIPATGGAPFGDIYDAFILRINGEDRHYISGVVSEGAFSVELPAGPVTVEWVYQKDPYTSEGLDRGRLSAVVWEPANGQIVRGAWQVDSLYRATHWWGAFTSDRLPWAFHWEWGWLYLVAAGDGRFWGASPANDLGWVLFDPQTFPNVYLAERQAYALYLSGSGNQGRGLWFYDYRIADWVRINP